MGAGKNCHHGIFAYLAVPRTSTSPALALSTPAHQTYKSSARTAWGILASMDRKRSTSTGSGDAGGDERQRQADDRESQADDRERHADDREHKADEREAVGNDRERHADVREHKADDRERRADEREKRLDQLAAERGGVSALRLQHAHEAIERTRALLATRGDGLDREEAGLKRTAASGDREQAAIDRSVAQTERDQARPPNDPGEHIEEARVLRQRLLAAAASLASKEDEVADILDELAAQHPEHASEYHRAAGKAREGASRAREVQRHFGD